MKRTKKPRGKTPSSRIRSDDGKCPRCQGYRWIDENLCPICNLAEPPALPPDFVRDEAADAALQEAEEHEIFGAQQDDDDDAAVRKALKRLAGKVKPTRQ